jgi:class 3 adenylate cyclase/tetratricopeptide (TPR) repeat protein
MECPQCQTENPQGRRFCVTCRTELPMACRQCGTAIVAGQNYCSECGAPLTGRLVRDGHIDIGGRHAADHLAARFQYGRAPLEGERKQVTVLFADIRGSTTLIEGLDPEQAWERLEPALQAMRMAVHRYEGTVNRLQGDGLMALFGAPLAHEDHAVRACYAALAMQEAVTRLGDPHLAIRVGLHSGEVVVRVIRSSLVIEYDAIGPTVHLASRMEQAATSGTILITATTRRLAQGFVETRALGLVNIRGLREPVETFELTGVAATRMRWQASASDQLTSFVGRTAELERLQQALWRAQAGTVQIVWLTGEPGVGKSRLIWEFAGSPSTRGWRVLQTGATSYSTDWPYVPIVHLLESYFAIDSAADAAPLGEQVATRLASLDPALRETAPALLALLGLPPGDPVWQALSVEQRRQRIHDAVARVLRRETELQPLLLIFEDLQWADDETRGLLEHLVRCLVGVPMLLLVSARPEYRPHWLEQIGATHLEVEALSDASADALLNALLGDDAELGPLKRLLLGRTAGNPFFLEESVRSLVETGVLTGPRGAHRKARAFREVRVPATVEALLSVRIDRLPIPEKRLLQAAAVIGVEVPLPILREVVDLPEHELKHRLDHLLTAQFLVESNPGPADAKCSFRHALTHEVAYSGLLREQRRSLHLRVVRAIERLHAARLGEHVEILAHHAVRGECWEAATRYLGMSGEKALARSANAAATNYLEEALVTLSHLPRDRSNLEQAVDLRFGLRNSLLALGEPERILSYLREAEAIATALDDRARLARANSHLAHCFWLVGDWQQAVNAGRRALELAETQGDFAVQVTTNFFIGLAYYSLGEYCTAIDFLGRNASVLRGPLADQRFGMFALPSVVSRSWLALCLAERGEFAQGLAVAQEALQIGKAGGQPFDIVQGDLGLGGLYLQKGELGPAIEVLRHSVELCRAAPVPVLMPRAAGALGCALALAGRVDEAVPLLEDAVERARAMRLTAMDCLCRRWLSEAYLLANRTSDAMREASLALEECRRSRAGGLEAWLLHVLGKIGLRSEQHHASQAERHHRDALTLARRLRMLPLQAHCHFGLGLLLMQQGNAKEAQAELGAAESLYKAMDMEFWSAALRGARRQPGRAAVS